MSWPTPAAYLYGWVRTDTPGHRKVTVGGSSVKLSDGYRSWPDFITELDTQLSAVGWSATVDSLGRVVLSGTSATVEWTDHLGWLLGMDRLAGESEGTVTSATSRVVPPAAIPLYGRTWERIDLRQEREIQIDRTARSYSYVFGGSRLWRFSAKAPWQAVRALREGWLNAGKVTVAATPVASWGGATGWSAANPGGYVTGYIVGIERADFSDDVEQVADVSIIVATEQA